MSDEAADLPTTEDIQETPLIKRVGYLGDGEGNLFAIEHPASPAVTAVVIRMQDGEEVRPSKRYELGRVLFAFASRPEPQEFLAVVIG